ncbi:MAG: protein kinase domain-containing protein [Aureliella sp.]
MTCPTDQQLKLLTLGQLSEQESDALFRHLHSCEQCQAMLETLDDGEDSLVLNLRSSSAMDQFGAEAPCKESVALAAAALATSRIDASGPSVSPTSIPREFGEYEILRPLGRGGMGSVYLAKHSKLGREVAIKVLASHRLADYRMRERFEQEMRAIGRLSHPNVVTAHDAREIEGTAVLVTEYIDGFDLAQISNRCGPLRIADACEVIRLTAVALQYTSDQGFVHRDVKPSNIMLSRSGDVKLLDLGLARLQYGDNELSELTGTGQAMGTADYVAPEQVTDSRAVDARADIYALGCTLFKLLTGSAPFARLENASAFAKMNAHVHETAPKLSEVRPEVPAKLARLVDSMLAKEPSGRPEKAMSIAGQLQEFSKGADLETLVEDAANAEPREQDSLLPLSPTAHPRVLRRRIVPIWFAVAAGFFGMLLGGLLGVLITIKYPDGTRAFLRIPDGSEIEISSTEGGGSKSQVQPLLSGGEWEESETPSPLAYDSDAGGGVAAMPIPLAFAIAETDLDEFKEAGYLTQSKGHRNRRWFPLAEDARIGQIPRVMLGGQWIVLVAEGEDDFIGWDDLNQQVSMMYTADPFESTQTLHLQFHSEAAKQLETMTSANIGKSLVVIINGKVYSASRIIDQISGRAQLSGKFARRDLTVLRQALDSGIVSEELLDADRASADSSSPHSGAGSQISDVQRQALRSNFFERTQRGRSRADSLSKAGSDPFGSSTADPFGNAGDDPFGNAGDDPFGSSDDDPFDGATNDPFGGHQSNPLDVGGRDPFGGSSSKASGNPNTASDPFDPPGRIESARSSASADAATKDPFGGDQPVENESVEATPPNSGQGAVEAAGLEPKMRADSVVAPAVGSNRRHFAMVPNLATCLFQVTNASGENATASSPFLPMPLPKLHGVTIAERYASDKLTLPPGFAGAMPASVDARRGFRFSVDWRTFVARDIRQIVDQMVGDQIFDKVVKGIKNDPEGPQVNLGEMILEFRNEFIVYYEVDEQEEPLTWVIAVPLRGKAPLSAKLVNAHKLERGIPGAAKMGIINNHLVVWLPKSPRNETQSSEAASD